MLEVRVILYPSIATPAIYRYGLPVPPLRRDRNDGSSKALSRGSDIIFTTAPLVTSLLARSIGRSREAFPPQRGPARSRGIAGGMIRESRSRSYRAVRINEPRTTALCLPVLSVCLSVCLSVGY